jgi:hypothetical protein
MEGKTHGGNNYRYPKQGCGYGEEFGRLDRSLEKGRLLGHLAGIHHPDCRPDRVLSAKPKDMTGIIEKSNAILASEAGRSPFKTVEWCKAQDAKKNLRPAAVKPASL